MLNPNSCEPAENRHNPFFSRLMDAFPNLLTIPSGDYPLAKGWAMHIIQSLEQPRQRVLILYAQNRVYLHIEVDAVQERAEIVSCECQAYSCDMTRGDELCPSLNRHLMELLDAQTGGAERPAPWRLSAPVCFA